MNNILSLMDILDHMDSWELIVITGGNHIKLIVMMSRLYRGV